MHRVDSRPPGVYLQFERNLHDSSGNGVNGTAGEYPNSRAVPPPSFTSDVPADGNDDTSLLNGAYGLYASRNNATSVTLNRSSASLRTGNYIRIPDTNHAFNASSFTVEMFIKVSPGITQDDATIVSKEMWSKIGNFGWMMIYRDGWGAGMIELQFSRDSSTYARIRTVGCPLTPGVWHHLAMTYDGTTRQVILYVDGVARRYGNHNGEISSTGVLNWDFIRETGDYMQLGFFNGGIDAQYDDFRFTPEVLDPLQMLTVGKLN